MHKIIITAIDEERGIGKDSEIPWHYSEDMKFFRRKTLENPVIMGRKTYESLPEDYRPLPKRKNIVLTGSEREFDESVSKANSLEEAYKIAEKHGDKVFMAGGSSVYEQTLKDADKVILTEIPGKHDCDRFFPELGEEWKESDEIDLGELKVKEYSRDL